ncbi:MAG: LeoA/HP0731 family dynamin-like GTPase [Culicoidibacterales bacterium]
MKTVGHYKVQQEKTMEKLYQLLAFVEEGKQFGFYPNNEIVNKIEKGISETQAKKLKVALIGGFSEGKTSIAAAWSGKYDEKTMKISQAESTDEINVYDMGEFELIDTPGLFGFKETKNQEKYKDITKKYVSEANLVMYVMNSNNPIKESHKEELNWLFKDLNLLPRTVFVLSRFDEEADIEDEEAYASRFRIKKDNVLSRMREFKIIENHQDIPLVAVAANPFDQGFSYWLENSDEYKKISRIDTLQTATEEVVKNSGGKNELVLETSKTIITDVMSREIPSLQKKAIIATEELVKLQQTLEDIKLQMNQSKHEISQIRITLREYISELFIDLIVQLKGTELNTFDEFFQKNVGSEFIVLNTNIQNEFERYLGQINNEIQKSEMSYNASINHYNSMVETVTLQSLKVSTQFLQKTKVSGKMLVDTRKFFNLKSSLKFRFFEAGKLAKNISNGIGVVTAVLGVGLEIWEGYSEEKKKQLFNQSKSQLVNDLEVERKKYIEFINEEEVFIEAFCPQYLELVNNLDEMQSEIAKRESYQDEFEIWKQKGEFIEADFKLM